MQLRGHLLGSGALSSNPDPSCRMRSYLHRFNSSPAFYHGEEGWEEGCQEASSTHHGKQAQRVVAPGRGVGHGLVAKVLELLLCLVKHLHALGVLVLQLTQLQGTREVRGSESPEH